VITSIDDKIKELEKRIAELQVDKDISPLILFT